MDPSPREYKKNPNHFSNSKIRLTGGNGRGAHAGCVKIILSI